MKRGLVGLIIGALFGAGVQIAAAVLENQAWQDPAMVLSMPGIMLVLVVSSPTHASGAALLAVFLTNLVVYGLLGAGIVWVVGSLWMVIRVRRPSPSHCRKCRYDLTGNTSGRCPECGQEIATP